MSASKPAAFKNLRLLSSTVCRALQGNTENAAVGATHGNGDHPTGMAIPFLARLEDREMLERVVTIGKVPALLSLGAALVGLAAPTHVEHIIVEAIGGLISTAMWKLLTYPSFILLGTGFVASSAAVGRPFRWAGCALSGVTFDLLTAGLGVFVGILPTITIELGWRGFFGGLYLVAVAVTGMGAMRLPARMLYGFITPKLLERRWMALTMGLLLAGSALVAAGAERWPEISADSAPGVASKASVVAPV